MPDNNICERSIRPVTLGRKNYLFMGSKGAVTLLPSPIPSLRPATWTVSILRRGCVGFWRRVADHKMPHIDELMPWNWIAE